MDDSEPGGIEPARIWSPLTAGCAPLSGKIRTMKKKKSAFTAWIEWDPEAKLYVGIVPGIPGAHTQGASLDELHSNLKEVLELCLEESDFAIEDLPHFVGLQQVEVGV